MSSSSRLLLALGLIASLAGCASVPRTEGTGEEAPKAEIAPAETAVDPKKEAVAAGDATADKPATEASAERPAEAPAETSRSRRAASIRERAAEAARVQERASETPAPSTETRNPRVVEAESRSAANAENAKLIAQLNEMSRELAAARAANARLRTERGGSPESTEGTRSSTAAAPKADPMDEKLAATLKSYGALRQELTAFFTEMERLRSENVGATTKVKDAVARSDAARAAVNGLENDLRAEKRARADAEAAVAKLQEQLRAIAKALSSAGLSIDKLAGSESGR